jgi:hypothetical protein
VAVVVAVLGIIPLVTLFHFLQVALVDPVL